MKINKCMALFLALVMALALVACGNNQDASTGTTDVPATTNPVSSTEHLALFEESIGTFMEHIITEVPREDWNDVMAEMPWPYRGINTFNSDDPGLHGDDTWAYYDGQFCVMADSWHFLYWSSNVQWDVAPDAYDKNRTFSLEDNTKDGYMLFLLGDYYFYLVEISSTRETNVTCLEDFSLDGFYTLWSMMDNNSWHFMKDWSANTVITSDTLDVLYAYESWYAQLDQYAARIDNQEDREEALSQIELGFCHDPIVTFLYDQEYRDFTFAILDGGMWDMQYTYKYANGIYSLSNNYFVTVEWTQNIHTASKPDDFYSHRHYEVIDPTEDSYILINNVESGYTLVRIVAQGDDSVHTPDTHPAYTMEEFKRLYANIADNCDESLAELAETGELTKDCLQYLRINAEDHEELYWYGERLTGTDFDKYRRLKDGGWIAPPLTEIDISSTSSGHLYSYGDNILTLESSLLEIVCTCNISEIQWDPYEHEYRNFFVADASKPAYIVVRGEGGYAIYYLTTG